MPSANPFAPLLDVGGGGSVGPVSGTANFSAGVGDHHATAGYLVLALIVLVLLHKTGRFRFSTQVG